MKLGMIGLAISIIVAGAALPVYAHDDGTMHIHVKGTLKTADGKPISGARLDIHSVAFIFTPDPTQGNANGGSCFSNIVSVINPTNAEGYYEVLAKFKNSYQIPLNPGSDKMMNREFDCTWTVKNVRVDPTRFKWTKDGLTDVRPLQ